MPISEQNTKPALYPSSRYDRPHGRLYDHDMNHPAWKQMTPFAFKVISMLLAKYRPGNPNLFLAGERTIAEMADISCYSAKRAIDELIEKGFLYEVWKGRNSGARNTRERRVSLTRHDSDIAAGNPDLPIKLWKKKKKSNA